MRGKEEMKKLSEREEREKETGGVRREGKRR